jgi:hypothetical protein
MRSIQKLVRNGNSTQITLPKPMLIANEWIPGEVVVITLQPNGAILLERWQGPKAISVPRGGVPLEDSAAVPR